MRRTYRMCCLMLCCLLASCISCRERTTPTTAAWYPEEIVTIEERRQEVAEKERRVAELAQKEGLSGILLTYPANIAWITAGGAADLTRNPFFEPAVFLRCDGSKFVIGESSEIGMTLVEELEWLGYASRLVPWFEKPGRSRDAVAAELSGGRPYGCDGLRESGRMLADEIAALHEPLTRWEVRKYRWLGKKCAEVVGSVGFRIRPWVTDRGIENMIQEALSRLAIRPLGVQVTADTEVPGAFARKVEKYAVINLVAARWGLVVSMARAVHVGSPPEDLSRRYEAVARINAGLWARTRPGAKAASIFDAAVADYSASGFPDAWKSGPRGGRAGYRRWEWIAAADSPHTIGENQAFAWRSSVEDAVVEDTLLLDGDRLVVLTEIPGWPVVERRALGRIYRAPGLLVLGSP